uniref:C2H2-type domain-containing protein n=1 Tax=Acrobeloides nanus TaxID=290746 RepID=A0A914E8Q1_9BILA
MDSDSNNTQPQVSPIQNVQPTPIDEDNLGTDAVIAIKNDSVEPTETATTAATSAEITVESPAVEKKKVNFAKGDGRGDSYKDENGFVFYKCRFCGLTYNYMTTLKAHERIHDIEQIKEQYSI